MNRFSTRLFGAVLAIVLAVPAFAATISATTHTKKTAASAKVKEPAKVQKRMASLRSSRSVRHHRRARRSRYYEHFYTSSFSDDNGAGDVTAGEDPVVRAAALEALGNMNGTVVAIDPDTGRILAMVNQKLALSEGAEPCSTIKIAISLAALSEGVLTQNNNTIRIGRTNVDLTSALAHSNNAYFEEVGRRLGFEKVSHYAHMFGLGELAGYNIEGEHLGTFPSEVLADKLGGVGKMCSFGESISLTPLQLGALVAAIANGGNLYYLQHPVNQQQVLNFQPRLKRTLDIAPYVPIIMPGMSGAVEYGTARSLRTSFDQEQVLGKTGTCSNNGTRFGWFASYANTEHGRIVTVFFLEGGHPTYGPKAAELSGKFYRSLYDHSFFAGNTPMSDSRSAAIGASH